LRVFTEQGRTVNHAGGPTYAPKMFAEHPAAEGCAKRALKGAMERLLAGGKIGIEKQGPQSKQRQFLVLK